jgi:Ser/Thr protein kinase RdoA (MazF antagonist)
MKQAITVDIVAGAAAEVLGAAPTAVVELQPRGTLRSFRCASSGSAMTLRVDEDPGSRRVDVEALAMAAARSAIDPPVVPELRTRHLLHGRDGIERRFLAYEWIDGRTLEAPLPAARAREVGAAFAELHAARVMDLWGRLPSTSTTLLDAYRRVGEQLKTWLQGREADGLGADLLTLAVSDLLRALRPWIVAQDNLFRTARRRTLCHGAPEPSLVIARTERGVLRHHLSIVALDRACLGDAAFDLATLSHRAELDDDAEDALLTSYVETLDALDRSDPHFVQRFFAVRQLELLARPAERLERIALIKRGDVQVLDDAVVALEAESDRATSELVRAMNGLRELAGRARPVVEDEVRAMGRVVTLEEMILAGRTFRLALTGQPYTGKTEVGASVARRLGHLFFGTAALSRALALVQREATTTTEQTPRALVARLFDRGFVMTPLPDPPYYRATLDGADVTAQLREGLEPDIVVAAGVLLDDEAVRAALRDALEKRFVGRGLVVEGLYADRLAPGRWRVFHLVGDHGVRLARLQAHRRDIDDADAAALLRRLDADALPPVADATRIDVGSRPAAAAALAVLLQLVPAGRRGRGDLGGRSPL